MRAKALILGMILTLCVSAEMCIRDRYLLLDKEVGKLRRELSRISKRKSDLYEDYSERLITEEEYIQFSQMCIRDRIYSEGIESGELKKAKASALSMAADGMKVDKIAYYLNVSVQMVQKWIDESMSVAHLSLIHISCTSGNNGGIGG